MHRLRLLHVRLLLLLLLLLRVLLLMRREQLLVMRRRLQLILLRLLVLLLLQTLVRVLWLRALQQTQEQNIDTTELAIAHLTQGQSFAVHIDRRSRLLNETKDEQTTHVRRKNENRNYAPRVSHKPCRSRVVLVGSKRLCLRPLRRPHPNQQLTTIGPSMGGSESSVSCRENVWQVTLKQLFSQLKPSANNGANDSTISIEVLPSTLTVEVHGMLHRWLLLSLLLFLLLLTL